MFWFNILNIRGGKYEQKISGYNAGYKGNTRNNG